MPTEVSFQVPELKKTESENKNLIVKDWFFWVVVVFLLVTVTPLYILMFSSSPIYELTKVANMSKQQIVQKYGKPDKIIADNSSHFAYTYNAGFVVEGTNQGVSEVVMSSALVKDGAPYSCKMFDITLGSSFSANVKRLGKPFYSSTALGKKVAQYSTKENDVVNIVSDYDSDTIAGVSLAVAKKK